VSTNTLLSVKLSCQVGSNKSDEVRQVGRAILTKLGLLIFCQTDWWDRSEVNSGCTMSHTQHRETYTTIDQRSKTPSTGRQITERVNKHTISRTNSVCSTLHSRRRTCLLINVLIDQAKRRHKPQQWSIGSQSKRNYHLHGCTPKTRQRQIIYDRTTNNRRDKHGQQTSYQQAAAQHCNSRHQLPQEPALYNNELETTRIYNQPAHIHANANPPNCTHMKHQIKTTMRAAAFLRRGRHTRATRRMRTLRRGHRAVEGATPTIPPPRHARARSPVAVPTVRVHDDLPDSS
jgi:hypothetical protein